MRNPYLLAAAAAGAILATQSASAADLARHASPYAPVYSWTGFYIGAHGGGGWGTKRWVDVTPQNPGGAAIDEGSHQVSGALAGGQIGFNYQIHSWVIGIDGQASWADLRGSRISTAFPTDRDASRVVALGTLGARLGYAWDNMLLYFKGGGAWTHDKYSITDIPTGITYARFDQTRWGWTIGGGLEYGLLPNWSVKIEYNYMDLGTQRSRNVLCRPNFGCVGPGDSFDEDVTQRLHVVKAGINYRFGAAPGPIAVRY